MANLAKLLVLSVLGMTMAEDAAAIPLNKCAQLVRDQGGREIIINRCRTCIAVKVERRRPGQNIGTPNMRDYNIAKGSRQPLPFRGPGITRITSEMECPKAIR
ncbi:MAG: hypothetical protein OQK24_08380 [Magnetovibrio sp.]|nr:hypothetical protein [Magnetovibrio sp.]